LDPLLGALRVIREGYLDEKIRLLLGPEELEIRIRAEVGESDATLCVDRWPDARRSKFGQPQRLFSISAPRQEIISAFVVALKKLRASVSDADFAREARSPFPAMEYELLMATVE
jgi:hypothetical protein